MLVFLALSTLYPNDRLSGFAMATKTCRAAKLYQRPLNLLKVSILGDKRLVPKKSADGHHDRSHNPLLRMRTQGN